jgi:hypothetical protein
VVTLTLKRLITTVPTVHVKQHHTVVAKELKLQRLTTQVPTARARLLVTDVATATSC